ncbi:hypothetical protein [Pseudoduganella violaceinigra]|uniref:hypothetical protein n=1 Tax=Pseudoduganella violaceinigra TaxID=246602 RepID=UPI0012B56144|nr:hypothetical protein [Pseudoduganella violaceinigra]
MDTAISIAGQDSIVDSILPSGSFVASLMLPTFATVVFFVAYVRLYSLRHFGRNVLVLCFVASQALTCGAIYRHTARRSFSDAQTTVLKFLKQPQDLTASYADGLSEKYVKALNNQIVDLIPIQALQRYQSYEFVVRPTIGKAFVVQLRGRNGSSEIFAYTADESVEKLTEQSALESFELPLFNVSLK